MSDRVSKALEIMIKTTIAANPSPALSAIWSALMKKPCLKPEKPSALVWAE